VAKAFGEYAVSEEGQQEAAEAAKSAPLSAGLSRRALESIAGITVAKS
jgi:phosphate transport system substrate-binding protein